MVGKFTTLRPLQPAQRHFCFGRGPCFCLILHLRRSTSPNSLRIPEAGGVQGKLPPSSVVSKAIKESYVTTRKMNLSILEPQ